MCEVKQEKSHPALGGMASDYPLKDVIHEQSWNALASG